MAKRIQLRKTAEPLLRLWSRQPVRACVCSTLLVSMLWTAGVLSRLENFVQAKFVDFVGPHLQTSLAGDLAVILADENPQKNGELKEFNETWRRHHGELVEALARAGARVVAFDISFRDPAPGDAEFAAAIRRASQGGTRVIVGAEGFEIRDTRPVPGLSTDLRPHISPGEWALLKIGEKSKETGSLRKISLAEPISAAPSARAEVLETRVIPSLALQVLARHLAGKDPVEIVRTGENHINLKGPAGRTIYSIAISPDMKMDIEMVEAADLNRVTRPYHIVWSNRAKAEYLEDNFKGKVVLIGYRSSDDAHQVPGGSSRQGYEVHASVISNLLLGNYIRSPRPAVLWLAIIAMSIAVAVLHLRFPRSMEKKVSLPALKWIEIRPSISLMTAVVAILYLGLAFVLYQSRRMVLEFSYPLAALFIADLLVSPEPAAESSVKEKTMTARAGA